MWLLKAVTRQKDSLCFLVSRLLPELSIFGEEPLTG
jgi:hypothetical protein